MARIVAAVIAVLLVVGVSGCGGATPARTATSSHTPDISTYVALGDSYTAAPLVPTTDTTSVCMRSDHNYPHLLARMLGSVTLTDVSCSGATTAALTGTWKGLAPQLDAVTSDTDLVTVGIGANDFGISSVLFYQCRLLRAKSPNGAPCRAKWQAWVRKTVPRMEKNVTAVLREVRSRAPDARIIAVDYPQVLPSTGSCAAMEVSTGDVAFIRDLIDEVDEAILTAARTAEVESIDLREASRGHDMCSKRPWINGVHELPGRAAALHPFESEQRAVARLLATKIAG